MPSPAPRRRAVRRSPLRRVWDRISTTAAVAAVALVVAGGLAAVVASATGLGPRELDRELSQGGAAAIAVAYAWAVAARTGGRPFVFGALALLLGVAVVALDRDFLATGAAMTTSVVAAVLAVLVTIPAVTLVRAVREVLVAVVVAGIGAVATVGFEPAVSVSRFEYGSLGLAVVTALALVYRLGAGLHGLGRRGLVAVLVGGAVLAVILAYAELLRRYGTPGLVESMFDGVQWSRERLGAFPRPLEAVLGIPALMWGAHMRARRRQGWWVCVFGVAATSPIATSLVRTSVTRTEASLATAYALVVGMVIGFLLIRADLWLIGSRGRRGTRAEEASALRPEPSRISPLL
ncbi:MAG: hypothetical protein ACRDOM_08645 [Nocardioides sp.]